MTRPSPSFHRKTPRRLAGAYEQEVVELVEVPLVEQELVEAAMLFRQVLRQSQAERMYMYQAVTETERHGAERAPLHPQRNVVVFMRGFRSPAEREQRTLPELGVALAEEVVVEQEACEQSAGRQDDRAAPA